MTSLACALAYVATLAFAAFLLWRKDRFREDVRDQIVKAVQLAKAVQFEVTKGREKWDAAASYTEAQQVSKGLRGIGR